MNTFIRIFIRNTPVLALKISKKGVGVYFGTPCYGYALNCLFVYFFNKGHACYLRESKSYLFYLHAASKNEIQICSNKHETGLVALKMVFAGLTQPVRLTSVKLAFAVQQYTAEVGSTAVTVFYYICISATAFVNLINSQSNSLE